MARQELKQRELLIYSEIGGVQHCIAQLCGGHLISWDRNEHKLEIRKTLEKDHYIHEKNHRLPHTPTL